MPSSILIVDDEKNIRLMTRTVLEKAGYHVVAVEGAERGVAEMSQSEFDLVLIDYMMPDLDGVGLILRVKAQLGAPPPMVLMTAYGSAEVAVQAMKAGAVDYIAKPFTADELLHLVDRNLHARSLEREVTELRARVGVLDEAARSGLVSESAAMKKLLATAGAVAASKAPVLIEGETGTGKEKLARLIHLRSPRANGPFIAVNSGALHPDLLLSELFGHRRGAFTGAVEDRVGRFEAADRGTLFLDEVGELDEAAQVKLLRVLQEGSFERVGEGRSVRVDVRIVAATNRRLDDMVAEGSFRSDLYYRLAVVTLYVPPLRDRIDDLMPLADLFLAEFAAEAGRSQLRWPAEARAALASNRWPGNIRELRNAVQRAVLLTPPRNTEVALAPLAGRAPAGQGGSGATARALLGEAEEWSLAEVECEYMRRLLMREDLKIGDVCRILKIDPATLWRKRKRYGF